MILFDTVSTQAQAGILYYYPAVISAYEVVSHSVPDVGRS